MSLTINHRENSLERQIIFLETETPFGETISICVSQRDVTRSQLAHRTGVGPSTITQWINGDRIPEIKYLYDLSDALNLNDAEYSDLFFCWFLTHLYRKSASTLREGQARGETEKAIRAVQDAFDNFGKYYENLDLQLKF